MRADTEVAPPAAPRAEQVLLESIAQAAKAEAARIDALLGEREAKLRGAEPASRAAVVAELLGELARECGCDGATAAELDLAADAVRVIAHAGSADPSLVSIVLAPALRAAVAVAAAAERAVEHPDASDSGSLGAPAAALLAAQGLLALRWSFRATPDGALLLLALHATGRVRYWTPPARRLHDGMCSLLLSAPGGV